MARALGSAGLTVVEVECPRRQYRRRGKSDLIDARLAALEVLRMDDVRKPLPRSDGDREAIRILFGVRYLKRYTARELFRVLNASVAH